jgi:hypothetical protein
MDHGPWMGSTYCPHWLLKILSYLVSLQLIGWEYMCMLVIVNNLPICWGKISFYLHSLQTWTHLTCNVHLTCNISGDVVTFCYWT